MGRREFLRRSLAAATVGLAGCSAFGGSEDVDENYEPDVEDNLATAVGQLNKAALAVSEFQDGTGDGDDGVESRTFDAEGPRERISAAREAITAAEENASDEQEADVSAVTNYADGVEGTVDSVVNVTTAGDHLEQARELLDSENGSEGTDEIDTEAASAALADATAASAEARSVHDTAATALEEADGERLAELDAEYDALVSGLETLFEFVVGVDGLAVGYDGQVDGIASLQTAQDRVDAEEFDAASQSFSDAQTAFTDSATAFTDVQQQAAADLQNDLTEGDERSRALEHLSAGYVSLLDSREHVLSAEAAIGGETDDSARPSLTAGSEDASAAAQQFADGAGIREGEFGEEFQTAQDRATAMTALVDGYTSVLDAREHIQTAENQIGEGESAAIQSSLDEASADATTADQTFASGQGLAENIFGEELSTGRSRASALDSLAVGYGHLLDGRNFLEDGESAFLDENYGTAGQAFDNADQAGSQAETTFTEGDEADDENLFTQEFDRAFRRASVLRSLSQGYTLVVQSREQAEAGRDELDNENFDAAAEQFQTAASTLDDAEQSFTEAQADASAQFGSLADRALCQVGHLQAAMDHFVAAAQAGSERDQSTLRSERNAGETDLDRVDDCG